MHQIRITCRPKHLLWVHNALSAMPPIVSWSQPARPHIAAATTHALARPASFASGRRWWGFEVLANSPLSRRRGAAGSVQALTTKRCSRA